MKVSLKKNMGTVDRIIRIITGIIFVYLGFINQGIIANQTINIFLGLFGLVSLISAIFAFCPMYAIGHISTNNKISDDS